MLLYRLIMWKRRWFGMAPQRYYIVECFTAESVLANDGNFPYSWLIDCPNSRVENHYFEYWRELHFFLWVIW